MTFMDGFAQFNKVVDIIAKEFNIKDEDRALEHGANIYTALRAAGVIDTPEGPTDKDMEAVNIALLALAAAQEG